MIGAIEGRNRIFYQGMTGFARNLAGIFGPVGGSFMFARFGYQGTLIMYAFLSLTAMLLSCLVLTGSEVELSASSLGNDEEYLSLLNEQSEPLTMIELRMRTKRPEHLTYGSLIGSRRPCCAFFTSAVAMFAMTFIASFFSLTMMQQYHISNLNIAFLYMAMTSSYAVSTIFSSMYFRAVPRRRQQIFSLMLLTFGVMLRSGGQILQFFPND